MQTDDPIPTLTDHTLDELVPEPLLLDLDAPLALDPTRGRRAPLLPAPGDFNSARDAAVAARALARRAHSTAARNWAHAVERYVQGCEAIERSPETKDARAFYVASKRALRAAHETLESRARLLLDADLVLVEIDHVTGGVAR